MVNFTSCTLGHDYSLLSQRFYPKTEGMKYLEKQGWDPFLANDW